LEVLVPRAAAVVLPAVIVIVRAPRLLPSPRLEVITSRRTVLRSALCLPLCVRALAHNPKEGLQLNLMAVIIFINYYLHNMTGKGYCPT
jgi:hypothetical protein